MVTKKNLTPMIFCLMILVVLLVFPGGPVRAEQSSSGSAKGGDSDAAYSHPEHGNLAEIGHKLSDPTSNVWAMYTEFDFSFSDGDLNTGASKVGGRMIFQPVLPFPLYGKGENAWKLITRPIVPIMFSAPVPTGVDKFVNLGGLGDIQLPTMVAPPTGNWTLALGPTWLFPAATRHEFGHQQWGVGPAAVVGYKTGKEWSAGVFPQYTFGIGGSSDERVSNLSLLYYFWYNLPNAWQIGTNPSISYNSNASSGNMWNVPVGITATKTTKIGDVPVKVQLGIEYSVIHQDAFGQVAQIKLNIIPVINALVQKPIFGGI